MRLGQFPPMSSSASDSFGPEFLFQRQYDHEADETRAVPFRVTSWIVAFAN